MGYESTKRFGPVNCFPQLATSERNVIEKFGERAFPGVGQKRAEETRIAELDRKIGQQVLEIDFLKRALQHAEQQRQLRAASGGAPFTNKSSAK